MEDKEKEESKELYYEPVFVKFPDFEKGLSEFTAKCNRYREQHTVVSSQYSVVWNNGSFVFSMMFCCERGEYVQG